MKSTILWILALLITLAAARYQRLTGPTHPVTGEVTIADASYEYELIRTHGGEMDAPIQIVIPDIDVIGFLVYKRFNVEEVAASLRMERYGDTLRAFLPHQPPAGKLEYFIRLQRGDEICILPRGMIPVIRFKGAVPFAVLLPHILLMFAAMLLSNRAGLEAISKNGKPAGYAFWAVGLLFLGGMIMGPMVQKFAFGSFWSGIPLGWDLTDNKTLIAMVGWIIAVIAIMRRKHVRAFVLGASILLLLIYSIPHSMMGSELNYETGEIVSSGINE